MRKRVQFFLLLSIFIILTGCTSTHVRDIKIIEREGVSVIGTKPDVKLTLLKNYRGNERVCSPREGDIADTSSSAFGFGISVPGTQTEEKIGEGTSQGALSLGGRNPEVLLARELMFRACELSSNLNADTELTLKIYYKFLKAIETISKTQTGAGTKGIGVDSKAATIDLSSSDKSKSDDDDDNDDDDDSN